MNRSNKFFLDTFDKYFGQFQKDGTPIAFYGIGEKTKLLVENVKGLNVVGLMDQDAVGETVYGQTVLSYDEVVEKVKTIIIVANMSIAETIYRRIAFLKKKHGIAIFFINGTIPGEIDESRRDNPYWEKTQSTLLRMIDENDIISFDLFDTLIMRKVLLPTDIFDLVNRELEEKHQIKIDFKNRRIEAEHYYFRQKDKYCNIHDIYKIFKELLRCSDELTQKIKQIEIETELTCCTPRETMVQCYEYAKEQGKTLLITTDSFLMKEHIALLLEKCGIIGFNHLLISCEERKLKYLGDMWQHVSQIFKGHRILHIGDNEITDVKMAQKHHINTFKIESAYDLLANSAFRLLCNPIRTLDDSILMGQLAVKFLNDPFILNKNRGSLPINNMFDLGYLSFGPLVLHYLLWLIRKSRECKMDKLLFFARDGYVLSKIYQRMAEYFNLDCPKAIYFLTSRRAASVAAIKTKNDIVFIINNMCKIKKIKFHQLLSTTFGVSPDVDDFLAQKPCYEIANDEIIEHIINRYTDKILMNAMKERQNYQNYINTLGLKDADKIGCVNFVGRGITQCFISKVMEKELSGFYFAKELDMLDICTASDKCYALYEEYVSPHISKSNLAMKFIFGEVVFSSPDEQLISFKENGLPVFEKRNVKRDFSRIQECHLGIESFIEDMMTRDDNLLSRNFQDETVDVLYGLFSGNGCICSEEVKESFLFTDYYNPDSPELILTVSQCNGK